MGDKNKYATQTVSGIVIGIGKTTDIEGYTETVIEAFMPSEDDLNKMSAQEEHDWTMANNTRMEAICKFLNDNNL